MFTPPLEGSRPPLGKILDPPLVGSLFTTGADPGFLVGGRQPSRRGRQHTNLPHFPKKLHEIRKIVARLGSATVQYNIYSRQGGSVVCIFHHLCEMYSSDALLVRHLLTFLAVNMASRLTENYLSQETNNASDIPRCLLCA